MHIDLNGLPYILNVHWSDGGTELVAEIVDEGFTAGVTRTVIERIDCVTALIERAAGITPDEETLTEIASYLDEHLQDLQLRTFSDETSVPLSEASGM